MDELVGREKLYAASAWPATDAVKLMLAVGVSDIVEIISRSLKRPFEDHATPPIENKHVPFTIVPWQARSCRALPFGPEEKTLYPCSTYQFPNASCQARSTFWTQYNGTLEALGTSENVQLVAAVHRVEQRHAAQLQRSQSLHGDHDPESQPTATFGFTLAPNLVGQGTVTSTDGAINCTSNGTGTTGTCRATYASGTKVTMNATRNLAQAIKCTPAATENRSSQPPIDFPAKCETADLTWPGSMR